MRVLAARERVEAVRQDLSCETAWAQCSSSWSPGS
jgi:hypothetical protein